MSPLLRRLPRLLGHFLLAHNRELVRHKRQWLLLLVRYSYQRSRYRQAQIRFQELLRLLLLDLSIPHQLLARLVLKMPRPYPLPLELLRCWLLLPLGL